MKKFHALGPLPFSSYFWLWTWGKNISKNIGPGIGNVTISPKAGDCKAFQGKAMRSALWFLAGNALQTGLDWWKKWINRRRRQRCGKVAGFLILRANWGGPTNPRFGRKKELGHGRNIDFVDGRWRRHFGERMMLQDIELYLPGRSCIQIRLPRSVNWTNSERMAHSIFNSDENTLYHWKSGGFKGKIPLGF